MERGAWFVAMSWGIAIAALIAFAFLVRSFYGYTMDDAFITFRYAGNLLQGSGLVFNPGEFPRSEGLTSPLYALIVAGVAATGIPMVTGAKLLGLAAHLGSSIVVGVLSMRLVRPLRWIDMAAAAPFGLLAGAALLLGPLAVANSVSGMETALGTATFAAFLLTIWNSLDRPSGSLSHACFIGMLGTAVPLLRPEMAIAVLTLLLVVAFLRPSCRRTMLIAVAVFLALGAIYFGCRYRYYGLPLPLPFYIKQGDFSLPGINDVSKYIRRNVVVFLLAVAAIGWALSNVSERRSREMSFVMALIVAVCAQLAYYTTIAHIMGFGQRFFQPISIGLLTLAAVGAAFLVHRLHQASLPRCATAGLIVVCVTYGLVAGWRGKDARWIRDYAPLEDRLVEIAKGIGEAGSDHPVSIALNDCGAIPFYSRLPIIDLAGLNNRNIARSRSGATVLEEIGRTKPDLVLLVARQRGVTTSLFGWELIESRDLAALGYEVAGFISVGPRYHYVVHSRSTSAAAVVLSRLRQQAFLDAAI